MRLSRGCVIGIAGVAAGVIITALPQDESLSRNALVYMGVLVAMVVLLIAQIFPDYMVVLSALACLGIAGSIQGGDSLYSFDSLFAPFSQSTYWLILFAFGINAALSSTGLLKRVLPLGYGLFPKCYRGRVLFLMVIGTVISPLIPSTNAKASILTPCAEMVAKTFGYKKGSRGAAGLLAAILIPATVTAHAFFSGSGFVYIALGVMNATEKYSWLAWLAITWAWLLMVSALSVLAILLIYRPESTVPVNDHEFSVPKNAMSCQEAVTGIILVITFAFWITEPLHGISYVLVALCAFIAFCLTGIFRKEYLAKLPWGMLIFIGGLMSIASLMGKLGINTWLVEILSPAIAPFASNVYVFLTFVCILTYLSRYLIISQATNLAVIFLMMAPFCEPLGMDPVILLFVVISATNVWTLSFHNTAYLSAMGAGGDQMAGHKDLLPMTYAYMLINILASLACIPLWKMMALL